MASKVLAKSGEDTPQKPKLHHDDLSIIEDDLKGEYDALNGLIKLVTKTKSNLDLISIENRELHSTIETLKSEMMGECEENEIIHGHLKMLLICFTNTHIQSFKCEHQKRTLPSIMRKWKVIAK